jgi:GT2 family glycosyltransferase
MSESRPPVDVVVPFKGDTGQLDDLTGRLARLELRDGDSLLIVDNTPGQIRDGTLHAPEIHTPAYARNRGAAEGSAEWLLFLDADVTPAPDLLDRYFEVAPADDTGLLAGGIVDEPVLPGGPPAARYAYIREFMSQKDTLRFGDWGFPKTANAAVRRSAFEAVGGFREEARAAEDADLTFRLKAAGWELERREQAGVVHRNRQTVRGFVLQKLSHGAGGAWLERRHPGSSPSRRLPGLLWWGVRHTSTGLFGAVRARDRDAALWALFEPLELIVHELGRWLPNERAAADGAARGPDRG